MSGDILVTGATGKTGRRVMALLRGRGVGARAATRTPPSQGQVQFDWNDTASFASALDGVRAVYMVAPTGVAEPLPALQPFIDLAVANGVGRLVLLSSSMIAADGPLMGAVHAYLRDHAPGWSALRPSWFMQNFSEGQHLASIQGEGRIYSATGEGRVSFIDAADIAAVAVEALTDPGFSNGELVMTGPATLGYDDVAHEISAVAGRSVVHHRLSVSDLATRYMALGIPESFARALSQMDAKIASGAEDRVTATVAEVTGRQPNVFRAFAQDKATLWSCGIGTPS